MNNAKLMNKVERMMDITEQVFETKNPVTFTARETRVLHEVLYNLWVLQESLRDHKFKKIGKRLGVTVIPLKTQQNVS